MLGFTHLLLGDSHVRGDSTDEGGLVELTVAVARGSVPFATAVQSRPLFDGVVDQGLNDVDLALHHHGAAVDLPVVAAARQRDALPQSPDLLLRRS